VPFGENANGLSGIFDAGGGPVVKYVGPKSKTKFKKRRGNNCLSDLRYFHLFWL
jgi:hypothetical protein